MLPSLIAVAPAYLPPQHHVQCSAQGKARVDTVTHVSRDILSIRGYPRQPYNTGVYGPVNHCARYWTGHVHVYQAKRRLPTSIAYQLQRSQMCMANECR